MTIRLLEAADVESFRALRLTMLRDAASAFGASPEDEASLGPREWAGRIGPDENTAVFGAYLNGTLVGSACLFRQRLLKMRHKALIWGVYVGREARGLGIGRQLMQAAIDHAGHMPALRQVTLSVTASNIQALALYRSLGFVEYGHEPDALWVDGQWYEEKQMVKALHPR
jgi:ribosomal protein S18 acetylase RimI-like enzyme